MAYKVTSTDINNWYKKLNFARTQSGIDLSSITEGSFTKNQTSDRIKALINNISNSRSSNSKFLGLSDYNIDIDNFDDGDDILNIDRNTIDSSILSMLRICPNINCQTVCNNTGTNSNEANTNGTCNNVIQSNGKNSDGVCNNTSKSNGTNNNGNNENGICINSAHSNGVNDNGTCANGMQYVYCGAWNGHDNTNSDGVHNNGTNSNVTKSNVTKSNGTNSNGVCSNVVNTNGTNSNGSNSYGTCTNGTKSNGTNSNGNKSNGCTDKIYDPNTVTYSAKNHYTEEEANNRVQ